MSNMSYCRNENTFSDLRDVRKNARRPTNDTEKAYLERILDECDLILSQFGIDISEDDLNEAKMRVANLRTEDDEDEDD